MNINNIINYRIKDPIFKNSIKALRNLNNTLGLSNRVSKTANINQILIELIEKYHYVGVYNVDYIREFIKIYTDAFSNEDTFERFIARIKLADLTQDPEYHNQLITIDEDESRYMMDENGYNRLHNKEYLADVQRRGQYAYIIRYVDELVKREQTKNNHDIFKLDTEQLFQINELLGLTTQGSIANICKNIIVKLIKDYHYIGTYDYEHIIMFIKIYKNAYDNDEDELPDMNAFHLMLEELVVSDNELSDNYVGVNKDSLIKLRRVINGPIYYMDIRDYVKLSKPETVIQYKDESNTINQLSMNNEYANNEYVNNEYENNGESNKTHTVKSYPVNNFLLNNKHMTRKGGKKLGMDELAHIVLNLQRDFKRVSNALSLQGAQEIVNKHNAKNPNNQWTAHDDDINGDNIPDIIIRNSGGHPIVVNGWTTKSSNYPTKYLYYSANPTREKRRENPFIDWKRDSLMQIQYDDENEDIHSRGNIVSYNANAYPQNWNVSKYNVRKEPKRMNAYQRFQKYIINPRLDVVIAKLVEDGVIKLNSENEKWSDKVKHIAKMSAALWDHYVINVAADRLQMDVNSAEFKKWKNKEGKEWLDGLVTEFFYHINYVNEQAKWTEDKRDALNDEFMHAMSDLLQHSVSSEEHIKQHHYAKYTPPQNQIYSQKNKHEFGDNKGFDSKPWSQFADDYGYDANGEILLE